MKTHCIINIGSVFLEPNKIGQYADKLDGCVVVYTYARLFLEEINMLQLHALHFELGVLDKKHIRAVANLITCINKQPKEVYFFQKCPMELLMVIREQWPRAKIFQNCLK